MYSWRVPYFYFIGYFKKIGDFNTCAHRRLRRRRRVGGKNREIYECVKLNSTKIIIRRKLRLEIYYRENEQIKLYAPYFSATHTFYDRVLSGRLFTGLIVIYHPT